MRSTTTLVVTALTLVGAAVGHPFARQAPAPKRAITIDQLIDIRHPSNPIWSPDSRRVAFAWERAGVSNLFIAEAGGSGKPVAVTTDGQPVANVFWGSDSRTVYFQRDGALMRSALDGSAPQAGLDGRAVRGPAASRDGKRVAYVSGNDVIVRPLAGDGEETTAATFEKSPSSVSWIDDTHLAVTIGGGGQTIRHEQRPDYSGAKIIYTITERQPGPPPDSYVVTLGGGAPVKYSGGPAGFGGRGNRWLDPSHFLMDRQSPDFKRRAIYEGTVGDGDPRLVHEDVKQTFWSMTGDARGGSQPSPDGKWILFLSDRDGWDQIYVAPASGGSPVQITKGQFESWRPSWSPDSTRIAFDSNEGPNPGSRHLGVIALNGDPARAKVTMVTSGRGTDIDPQWSPDGHSLVYQHTDPRNSADLWALDVSKSGAKPVRLTDSMPAGFDKSALVEPQLVHYPGPDGKSVPAYLFVPANLDKTRKHPAIVWVHGDGVNQNYDGWHVQRNYAVYYSFHQYLLQQGYVVLAPDYGGSIGYGAAWRERVYMDVGGKDFKDAAMSADYLKTLPYVDTDRVGIWGLSYGGFFTLLAVTEMPTTWRAAVDVAGVVDYAMYYDDPYHGGWTASRIGTPEQNPQVYAQASPISHIDRLVRPLLILHGTADVNVPYLHSVRLVDALLKHDKGPLFDFMTYPGEFHYFTREHVLRDAWTRVDNFFREHLQPEKAGAGSR